MGQALSNSHTRSVTSGRIIWIDIIRCAAVICVVLLHVAAYGLYSLPLGSQSWFAANAFNALSRAGIPMFVMVSGAMHLPRSRSMRPYIKRAALALLFWGSAYAILVSSPLLGGNGDYTLPTITRRMIESPEHLWFLYMIIGLYLLTPILRQVARNSKVTCYSLALWGIFCILIPTLAMPPVFDDLTHGALMRLSVGGAGLYAGYFILGSVLAGPAGDKLDHLGIPLFLLGVCLTFGLITTDMLMFGAYHGGLNYNSTVNVSLTGIGGFLTIRHYFKRAHLSRFTATMVNLLAVNTMGIYLIHFPLNKALLPYVHTSMVTNGWLVIPGFAIVIGVTTFIMTVLMTRLPYLRRLL